VDALAVKADQSNGRQFEAAVGKAVARFGAIQVLINSAAVYRRHVCVPERNAIGIFIWMPTQGAVFVCVGGGRQMLARKIDGKIINFADWSASRPTGIICRMSCPKPA